MRARYAVVTLLILLASREAAGEPAPFPDAPVSPNGETKVQTVEPRVLCVTDLTRCITLPPGRFLDEDTWQRIDAEHRRLQNAETRLDAENRSLHDSVSGWQPGWKILVGTLVLGFAGGAAAYHYTR